MQEKYHVVHVNVGDVKVVEFHLDTDQIEHLLQCGRRAALDGAPPAPPSSSSMTIQTLVHHVCYQVALKVKTMPERELPPRAAQPPAEFSNHLGVQADEVRQEEDD